jgi:GNAT superfamily N-acetyltransferase
MALLSDRGYRPFELTNVMFRELGGGDDRKVNPDIVTRVIDKGEIEMWARTAGEGWSTEMPGLEDFMYNFTLIGAQSDGARPLIGELDGKAIVAGASTIPSGRRQGAQTALLDARLRLAADEGCTLAIMGALPGSQSQRNAEKNGFRVAYTRTKWQLIV